MNDQGKNTNSKNSFLSPAFTGTMFHFCCLILFFFMDRPFSFFFAGQLSENLNHMFTFAKQAATGLLPYKDVALEYPPLSAAFLWLLAPFSNDFYQYQAAFTLAMSFVSIITLHAVIKLAASDGQPRQVFIAAFIYTAGIICAGPIGIVSLDYIPAALTIWSLYFLTVRKVSLSAGLLAAAVAAKGYPLVLFPLYVLYLQNAGGYLRKFFTTFIITLMLLFLPAIILSPSGLLSAFTYHAERGIEIGSIYSAVILLIKGKTAEAVFGHGGWNIEAGSASSIALKISGPFMVLLLFLSYAVITKVKSLSPAKICAAAATVLLAAIIGFKVGSPQFICWLIPLVAVCASAPRASYIILFLCGSGLASQWIFPWNMQKMVALNPAAANMLVVKWLFLVILFATLIKFLLTTHSLSDTAKKNE